VKKIIHQNWSEIFEKNVYKNGKLFLVRFVVVERGARLCGRIISCEEIRGLNADKTQTERGGRLYLPIHRHSKAVKDEGLKIKDSFISPFFTLEFFMSQMTRAPSFQ